MRYFTNKQSVSCSKHPGEQDAVVENLARFEGIDSVRQSTQHAHHLVEELVAAEPPTNIRTRPRNVCRFSWSLGYGDSVRRRRKIKQNGSLTATPRLIVVVQQIDDTSGWKKGGT